MTTPAGPAASPSVSASAVEHFRRDGVVLLRAVLDEDEVATLARGVERNLADLSPLGINGTQPGRPGAFVEDFRNWDRIAEYEQVIRSSALAGAAGALMGSREVRLFHDHLLVKEAGTLDHSPWHQDQPYYGIDGSQTVSFWIPLDPVARASALEFVAGSHAGGTWYMPRSFVAKTPMVFDEGALEEVPDVDADRDAFAIKGWAMEPGDAVAFNMLTLHAAAGSPTRRRAFSVRFTGDDVTWAPRPHRTSPPFDEVGDALAAGDPLEHALFPVVWSAPQA
ncbi:MAG TPA: phytanoyl-CoA dioxygenase family protein [Baekduia sp.]|jgi:ectoine hydroxylase-related dioxygenase (phytanoyl-CoA dioxygenase family)|nr:phytanoyl-CoA dioxygenase family protein [Baekduia sp.]